MGAIQDIFRRSGPAYRAEFGETLLNSISYHRRKVFNRRVLLEARLLFDDRDDRADTFGRH